MPRQSPLESSTNTEALHGSPEYLIVWAASRTHAVLRTGTKVVWAVSHTHILRTGTKAKIECDKPGLHVNGQRSKIALCSGRCAAIRAPTLTGVEHGYPLSAHPDQGTDNRSPMLALFLTAFRRLSGEGHALRLNGVEPVLHVQQTICHRKHPRYSHSINSSQSNF